MIDSAVITKKLPPEKFRILSGSTLKLIALVTMIIDHIGGHVLYHIPAATSALFSIGSHSISLYMIARYIGRLAFPIYCFLIVEGYIHTHSKKRYGINLLVFALLSEIPWNLEHSGKLLYGGQNVFFTLLFGYLALVVYDKYKEDKLKQGALLFLLFAVTYFFRCDYGVRGFCVILLMYLLKDKFSVKALTTSVMLTPIIMILAAFIPIGMYSGKRGFIRGKALKYAFYAAYPIHIFILYLIKLRYFGFS